MPLTTSPPNQSGKNSKDPTIASRRGSERLDSSEAAVATASHHHHPLMPSPEDGPVPRGLGKDTALPTDAMMDDDDHNKKESTRHRPPMSVIVVSSPAPASSSSGDSMLLGPPSGLLPRASSRAPRDTTTATSSIFSTPFRLQPRNAMAVGVTGRDGAVRGRKRSAQSMSASKMGQSSLLTTKSPSTMKELVPPPPGAGAGAGAGVPVEMEGKSFFLMGTPSSLSSADATTPKRQPPFFGSTPPRDHTNNTSKIGLGRVDNTMVNFQCLSLQSPKRTSSPQSLVHPPPPSGLLPPPSSSSASSSSGSAAQQQRLPMVPGSSVAGSFHQSPAAVSNSCIQQPSRSSFTPVYHNSASPGGSSSMRSYGSGSIGSNTRMNTTTTTTTSVGGTTSARLPVAAHSPSTTNCGGGGSGSTKSSPKLAPLTVLQDRSGAAKLLPNRDSSSSRQLLPPLPGGGMSSLWLSLESSHSDDDNEDKGGGGGGKKQDEDGDDNNGKMWPPRTVHCRKPSSDSISTVQNSVLSPIPPRPSPRISPGGCVIGGAGGAFSSPGSALGGGGGGGGGSSIGNPKAATTTPRSVKQRRVDEYTTASSSPAGQPTPRTPRTPLPRVTLTPRSTGSRRSRRSGQGLPRFPSPSDVDMDVTSPFLNSAAAATLRDVSRVQQQDSSANGNGGSGGGPPPPPRQLGTIRSSFPASSNSLALSADGSTNEGGKAHLPVLDLSPHRAEGNTSRSNNGASSPVVRELGGGTFMGIQTMSLLNYSHSGGILQAMMEEGANGGMEMGSVSDIDEDEGFILASPSAIEEERFASCQPARQRRRKSCDRFTTNHHAPSSEAAAARGSPSLSPNANLTGMNYVTSNTSLFGMDIAHPPDHAATASASASAGPSKTTNDATSSKKTAKTPDNATLVDPGFVLANPQDVQTLNRRKSDASFDSVGLALDGGTGGDGGRDLVTPPAMANPETPPPLSPKEGFFMPVVMPEGTVQHNFARRQAASVCIAGADRKSVTMAIARMATEAHGHAESSPVL